MTYPQQHSRTKRAALSSPMRWPGETKSNGTLT
jgi:hypothetical protein